MIYIAVLLPVLFGVGLLVVDGARLFNLQSLLQNGADALALAGAKELDGRATSITRANNAIAVLIVNQHRFGGGGAGAGAVTVSDINYLTGLPANDADPIGIGLETLDPAEARFVEVIVTPVAMNTIFPASLLGGSNVATTGASAVAGFKAVLCDFTPVYICNPFEGPGTPDVSILDAVNDPSDIGYKRWQINLKQQGGTGAQNSPGNYGLLQPPFGNQGANALRDMIGMSKPPICFLEDGVKLRPGFVATIRDAVNVRFDVWNGPMNSKKNDVRFRPAKNVRKGYVGTSDCNTSLDEADPPTSRKLGRDDCFTNGGPCPHMGGRMGDGVWDFNQYWETNFGTTRPDDPGGIQYHCVNAGNCINPPSRYEIYRYEIANGLTSVESNPGGPPGTSEMGDPTCSNSLTSDDPDRRMLFGAVINCIDVGLEGGASGPYEVEAFVKFFITEAMETGPDQDIYVEMVDVFEPGADGGVVRDDVQLYR